MESKAFFLRLLRPLIMVINKLVFRVQYIGVENIPKKGNAILAGNHTSYFDCLLLVGASKRPPHFLVKKELYNNKLGAWFFKNCGTIPVDRSKKNPEAIESANKYLNNNNLIAIFPEGTINRTDDVVLPFKYGAVKMSNQTDSPIIPFVIKGKYKYFRKSVSIKFLKPLFIMDDLELYNDKLTNVVKSELERK